jgi:spore coat protein A, manganese oxidase
VSRTNGVIEPYEQGFKDTFFLRENQVIDVVAQFGPNRGKYMFHCHNLVHEDNDMMRAFEVGQGGPDPVTTAPPRPFTANILPL